MGWEKIIFKKLLQKIENFHRKYPILWVFRYGYGLVRYTQTDIQNPTSFGYKALSWPEKKNLTRLDKNYSSEPQKNIMKKKKSDVNRNQRYMWGSFLF